MKKVTWEVAGVTDTGLVRSENQDNYYISQDQHLFVVADGMGGIKGGATASRIAVETLKQMWDEHRPDLSDQGSIETWLQESVAKANQNICAESEKTPNQRMGTTIVVAVQPMEGQLHIAHVGDSRAYLTVAGSIAPVTNDHSVVMEMVRKAQITVEQSRTNPFRHLLTRCLGHEREVEIETTKLDIAGDTWMIICSDGLSAVLVDEEIASTIGACECPEEVVQTLLAKTLEAGAPDNVTIIAVRYTGDGASPTKTGTVSEPKHTPTSVASAE